MNRTKLLAIDPIRAKLVKKIQALISDAKAGTVPEAVIEKLERIENDYAEGRIVTISELKQEILTLGYDIQAEYLAEVV